MTFYSSTDINFTVGGCRFHAVNMSFAEIKHDIPFHSHGRDCYEMHYISDGFGVLKTDSAYYRITPGTLFVTGPHTAHSQLTDINSPMQEWCIYLRADRLETGKYDEIISGFLSCSFWIGQGDENILPLLRRLFFELDRRMEGYRNMAGLLISEMMISIARGYVSTSVDNKETGGISSERTSVIIEDYFLYDYRNASLTGLADRLGLSARQTQRVIGRLYGSSFECMKSKARMSAAEIMLADPSLSLEDISERLGYSSREYFTAAFKKYYRTSPGKFRKSNIQKL